MEEEKIDLTGLRNICQQLYPDVDFTKNPYIHPTHEDTTVIERKQQEQVQTKIEMEQAYLQEEKDEKTLRIIAAIVYLVIGIIAAGALIAAYPNDGGATYTAIVIIFAPFAVAAYSAYFENPGKAILRGIGVFIGTVGITIALFPIIWLLTL